MSIIITSYIPIDTTVSMYHNYNDYNKIIIIHVHVCTAHGTIFHDGGLYYNVIHVTSSLYIPGNPDVLLSKKSAYIVFSSLQKERKYHQETLKTKHEYFQNFQVLQFESKRNSSFFQVLRSRIHLHLLKVHSKLTVESDTLHGFS